MRDRTPKHAAAAMAATVAATLALLLVVAGFVKVSIEPRNILAKAAAPANTPRE
jgi:hypothetical protein